MTIRARFVLAAIVAVALTSARPAQASNIILNGGFETFFAGWTMVDQAGGSGGWFQQAGNISPLNGFLVGVPPQGSLAAMTDQTGPGSHVLYQDIVIPAAVSAATLDFQYFISNQATAFYTPASLDVLGGFPNQQARVDFITTSADPFSVAAGDVLLNIFQTQVGDPATQPYTLLSTDVTAFLQAHAGQTIRLRFTESDNQLFFNFGIDAVSLEVESVPEPATLLLVGSGALAFIRRRRAA
jgi:hypothetical protein